VTTRRCCREETSVSLSHAARNAAIAVVFISSCETLSAAGGIRGCDHISPATVLAFGACVFLIGVFLAPLRLERSAYRYAIITPTIVMLIPTRSGWIQAFHRFLEVFVGIPVGLVISTMRPERGVE